MPITFDLLSILPYLFTVASVLGAVCCLVPFVLVLGVIFGRQASRNVPARSGGVFRALDVAERIPPDFVANEFEAALVAVERSPAELFPPNKIVVRCGKCGEHIRAGDGYSHYNIGTRKFFCRDCHLSKGLPLRNNDDNEQQKAGQGGN